MNVQTIILGGYTAQAKCSGTLILGTDGSYGNEQLSIQRKPDWEGLNIRVVFQPSGAELSVPEDGILSVPLEATAQTLSHGQGYILFQGATEGRVINTAGLPYLVQAQTPAEEVKRAAYITLDATLTAEGKAADAKAVGNAVFQLKSDLAALENIVKAIQEKLNFPLPVDAVTVNEINDMLVEYFESKTVSEVEA